MSNQNSAGKNLMRYVIGGVLGLIAAVLGFLLWMDHESASIEKKDKNGVVNYLLDEQGKRNLRCADLRQELSGLLSTRLEPAYSAYRKNVAFDIDVATKREIETFKERLTQCDRLFSIAAKYDIRTFPDLSYAKDALPEFSIVATTAIYGSCGADCSQTHMSSFVSAYDKLKTILATKN